MVEGMKLSELLRGREERAACQVSLLEDFDAVVQVALNIPGLPKDPPGAEACVATVARRFVERLGRVPQREVVLANGAGPARLLAFSSLDGETLKALALTLEEEKSWGRLLDIDVIDVRGALSREGMDGSPRSCLLCDLPAKTCARLAGHRPEALRTATLALLAAALDDLGLTSSTPGGADPSRATGPEEP
ncbi:MAG: citrate lyase holo-[acyl-carrier protein] synthase [Synergistaceae bacterium]|nr:citrate lyase holo-[acyl-carrier protein] synthase [Synergistaceae bacterium]